MTKGQHGNKEKKKPKQAPAPVVPVTASDVKLAGGSVAPRKK